MVLRGDWVLAVEVEEVVLELTDDELRDVLFAAVTDSGAIETVGWKLCI